MGIFRRLFSSGPDYPLMNPRDPAARRVTKILRPLESLAQSVPENLELVPGVQKSYVFVGKPPKRFGLAWIENGKVHRFREEARKKGVAPERIAALGREVRQAYEESRGDDRYRVTVAGRRIIVTPSRQLELSVEKIVAKAVG